jgi:hypothetical protein
MTLRTTLLRPAGRGVARTAAVMALTGALLCVGTIMGATATQPDTPLYVTSQGDFAAASSHFQGISCFAQGVCVAVGGYYPGNVVSASQAAIGLEAFGGWSVSHLPSAAPAVLNAVSCPSLESCVAVGTGDSSPIAFVQSGSQWVALNPALPTGYTSGELLSVSCPTVGDCVAVGTVTNAAGTTYAYIESLADGSWSTTPPATADASLLGVSCAVSITNCVAVGGVGLGNAGQYLIDTLAGGKWMVQSPASPGSSSAGTVLTDVSCATSTACVAVGGYGGSGLTGSGEQAGSEVLSNGTWVMSAPSGNPVAPQVLSGVSCPDDMNCVAVGRSAAGRPLLERYTNDSWQGTAVPGVVGVSGAGLERISCGTPVWCQAAGGGLEASFVNKSATPIAVPFVATAAIPTQGYWEVGTDGGVFSFGTANYQGSTGGTKLVAPIDALASTPDGGGYWLAAEDGGVFAFGDASYYGSMGSTHLAKPIIAMASTPDGHGYWLVALDGGVFAFGDAKYYGSTGAMKLNRPIVGIAADPVTGGYWLVGQDGGVFSFNAPYLGGTGKLALNAPMESIAATPDGGGYWMVSDDGGVFTFGDATFFGSLGGHKTPYPIASISPTSDGGGYFLTALNGAIFDFGDAQFYGDAVGQRLNGFIVRGATAG